MRWPWRRAQARVVFIGGSPLDALTPEPEPEPTPAPAPVPPQNVPEPHVSLGFTDGTTMTLDDDDPRAVALREVAASLARRR